MKLWKFNNSFLDISTEFIYEVDLFKFQDNCWNLENSRRYSSKQYIEGLIEFQQWNYDSFKLFKFIDLISAPINWLEKNAELVEYETAKEKRKKKLLEKKNESK